MHDSLFVHIALSLHEKIRELTDRKLGQRLSIVHGIQDPATEEIHQQTGHQTCETAIEDAYFF